VVSITTAVTWQTRNI